MQFQPYHNFSIFSSFITFESKVASFDRKSQIQLNYRYNVFFLLGTLGCSISCISMLEQEEVPIYPSYQYPICHYLSKDGILDKRHKLYIVTIQASDLYGHCYLRFVETNHDQSCTRGMIHYKIHLIIPGCPQPSMALQCRIVA